MDDGYYDLKNKSSLIYLGRVSRPEAETLQKSLQENFSLEATVYDKKNKGFALFFGVVDTKKLHSLIRPFIVESLKYKLFDPVTT